MHHPTDFQQTLPHFLAKRSNPKPLRSWRRPTFGEFVRQVEHEFGDSVDLSSLTLTRPDPDEALTPHSIRALCDLLGVPPEDFGV